MDPHVIFPQAMRRAAASGAKPQNLARRRARAGPLIGLRTCPLTLTHTLTQLNTLKSLPNALLTLNSLRVKNTAGNGSALSLISLKICIMSVLDDVT